VAAIAYPGTADGVFPSKDTTGHPTYIFLSCFIYIHRYFFLFNELRTYADVQQGKENTS
jgi:hypothetical protein